MEKAIEGHSSYNEGLYEATTSSAKLWLSLRFSPLRDTHGKVIGGMGVVEDVTERKNLENQLYQAQKMGVIGQLAGGVAHDFNNLLTAVMGYSEFMLNHLNDPDQLKKDIAEIIRAGERAALLTNQLLTFSRRRVPQLKLLDLNTLIDDTSNMLHHLIANDINLITILKSKGSVKVNPVQIQQVILNLAVNACDAMPKCGRLTIGTADVHIDEFHALRDPHIQPTPYVLMKVSDTGCGMDRETLSHIFEPFFTTKEQGKGIGLGLSTVYGIIKQSGGHVEVSSEPWRGTTFRICLPRVEEVVESTDKNQTRAESKKGSETILLVVDEDTDRNLVSRDLRTNGYTVLEARHSSEALLICGWHENPIHLLIKDVVMPRMSGHELAECLLRFHPGMKVLYLSGYADHAILHHGILETGACFLQKPFTPDSLAHKVHDVLDMDDKNRNDPDGAHS